ncbi:sporulation protein YjcZ [Guptibacillus algicola]|nr:sporulation protein YjcZ [Alkalihalobacillus algicola]
MVVLFVLLIIVGVSCVKW